MGPVIGNLPSKQNACSCQTGQDILQKKEIRVLTQMNEGADNERQRMMHHNAMLQPILYGLGINRAMGLAMKNIWDNMCS